MKLWIKNFLQNIINRIEAEEDTTPPEDYLNNIIEYSKKLSAKYDTRRNNKTS
jgi:hypothetical protein